MLGDVKHCEQAQSIGIDARSVEDLKKLNKNKKLVKKLGESSLCVCGGGGMWGQGGRERSSTRTTSWSKSWVSS